MRFPKLDPRLLFGGVVVIHWLTLYLGGFFLSPEFTLYPFLAKNGFLPYLNIIDQHFPLLLFGPLSLPSWLTVNPQPLLLAFLILSGLTDLFLFISLIKHKVSRPLFWVCVWVASSYWFSGNTLWLETFIVFFLSLIFFLDTTRPLSRLAIGVCFSLVLMIKPTLLPMVILLLFYLKLTPDPHLVSGLVLPPLIIAVYFSKFNLWSFFFELAVRFNGQTYTRLAAKLPTIRQLVEVGLVFVTGSLFFFRKRRWLILSILFTGLATIWPRFEYIHLQPALYLLIVFLGLASRLKPKGFYYPLLLLFLLVSFGKTYRHHYGNFYLDSETVKVVAYLKEHPGTSLYLLNGNDIIYALSRRTPPFLTYLPSSPWYFHEETYLKRVIYSLVKSPTTPVLVRDTPFEGKNILESSGPIWHYIKQNYRSVATIGSYTVYQRF